MSRLTQRKHILSVDDMRELVKYEPDTGKCYWKVREPKWFPDRVAISSDSACKSWNKNFSGKEIKSVNQFGYIAFQILGNDYKLHRFIWEYVTGGKPDSIDHINGDKLDNRICNLRNVTFSEQMRNMPLRFNNKSGKSGVSWDKPLGKWKVGISVNNKNIYLGYYHNLQEAIAVREKAEIKYGYHKNHGRV